MFLKIFNVLASLFSAVCSTYIYRTMNEKPSVADPGCLSRILFLTHPRSRISDPGSKNNNKRQG
jgi:hypothetical protein